MFRRVGCALFGAIAKTGERQYAIMSAELAIKEPTLLKPQRSAIECCMSGCRNCPFGYAATEVFSSMKNGG